MSSSLPAPISDNDRERVAELLQRASGEGRVTLEEFSARVGAVWAADTAADLARATADLAPAPVVGSAQPVERVVTVFSENKRLGRWRLAARKLRTLTVFGACELDLREVLTGADLIEISGGCVFGELKVTVPEGVEVELTGMTVFSARSLHLAPVPRVPGTPLIRVHVNALFGAVTVSSSGPRGTSSWHPGTAVDRSTER